MKFKVGDWVICNIEPFKIEKIKNNLIFGFSGEVCEIEECEPWQPKEGKWVWCKKRNKLTNNVCELIKFYFNNTNIGDCEPFIGELPSFLKDK